MISRKSGALRALVLAFAFASVVALAFALSMPMAPGAEVTEDSP